MNFRTFLTRLAEADARFVVVGGVAASLYGSPRVTFDIDVVPDMDPTNWSRIVDAVWAAGGRPRIPENLDVIRDLENVRRWIEEKGMLALSFRSAEGLAEIDLVGAEADRYATRNSSRARRRSSSTGGRFMSRRSTCRTSASFWT